MLRVFRSTKLRYLLLGIAAFMLGSATIGAAAASSDLGSLFYTTILNGQPTQPCVTTTTGQGSTTVCNAIVDSNGNLHVTGTTSVNGAVKLDPSGNTVQLASGTAVGVNGTVNVSNVNDGRQPFEQLLTSTFAANAFPSGFAAFGVPLGKELVIESVSVLGTVPSGQKILWVNFAYDTASGTAFFFLPMSDAGPQGYAPNEEFVGTQSTRLYIAPGGAVQISGQRSDSTGTGSLTIEVSGYLINV